MVAVVLSNFAGGNLMGRRFGDGPPRILALHGWRSNHASMQALVQDHDAIAVDLPGFGASPEPTAIWGAADYAAALAPVLAEAGGPMVVVGHSFGGRVATCLAAEFPDSVEALVLTGVPLIRRAGTKKPSSMFRLAKWANRKGLYSNAAMERQRNQRGSADYRAAQGIMRSIFVRVVNESYEDQIAKLRCPVELVWGEHDTEAPLAVAQQALAIIGHDQKHLSVVPGAGHWLPTEDPHAIRTAIEKVLA